jgi:hypothetical protein
VDKAGAGIAPASVSRLREMIVGIDHLVITVADLERTVFFYTQVLGMRRVGEPGRPTALTFGSQKINVYQ